MVYEILRWYQRRGYLITGTCKVALLAVVVGAGGGQRIAHGVVREVVGVRQCRCRRLIGDGERTTYLKRCTPGGFRVPHLDFEILILVCKLQSVTVREGKCQRHCCVHVLCIRVRTDIPLPDFHVMLCADNITKHNPGTTERQALHLAAYARIEFDRAFIAASISSHNDGTTRGFRSHHIRGGNEKIIASVCDGART